MNSNVNQILAEVHKVIVGKDDVMEKILMTLISRGHVLLDDVPGTGKTTAALAFHRALGLRYGRIQFTPDVLPSDIVGFSIYRKESGTFVYQPGAVMTNLLLADEINRTSSKTQAALLEVMEERQVTVDGVTHPLPVPFAVIATQNPVGSAGTQLLAQAQLDRFMVRLEMGYPDFESQVNILRDRQQDDPLTQVREVSSAEALLEMQRQAQSVHMADAPDRGHARASSGAAGRQPARRAGCVPHGKEPRLHARPGLCSPGGRAERVHRRLRAPSVPRAQGKDLRHDRGRRAHRASGAGAPPGSHLSHGRTSDCLWAVASWVASRLGAEQKRDAGLYSGRKPRRCGA